MSDLREPDFGAVERRLAARADHALPAGHRDRVLAAVRDTLAGRTPPRSTPAGLDAGSMAAITALALSALLAVVAPWLVLTQAAALVPPEPRIVAQARAAGIDVPVELVTTTPPRATSLSRPGDVVPGPIPDAWRLRTLLQGEL